MFHFTQYYKKITSLAIVASLSWVVGCGAPVEQGPVASGQTETTMPPTTGRAGMIAFTQVPMRATKYTNRAVLVDSDVIGIRGGRLKVTDNGDETPNDDFSVKFTVLPYALAQAGDQLITMSVTEGTLSQTLVAFEPVGLNFLFPAVLQFELGNDLIDLPLEGLKAWHIHGDGHIDPTPIVVLEEGARTKILVMIPGFSRYSFDD